MLELPSFHLLDHGIDHVIAYGAFVRMKAGANVKGRRYPIHDSLDKCRVKQTTAYDGLVWILFLETLFGSRRMYCKPHVLPFV